MELLEIINIATAVVTAASAVTAVTPTPQDDGIVRIIKQVLDIFALNVGNAKSKR